ncbi:MAG: hypothetical protein ACOYLE_11215 [Bacteroidales bacterium]
MEDILKTILLEYEKSTFLIDLVKHNNDNVYISVQQIIHQKDGISESQKIKINPSFLNNIIEVLTNFQKEIPNIKSISAKNYISNEMMEDIKIRYLKGVDINDLAIQFECYPSVIEQILRNSNIEIVCNKMPKTKKRYFKFKKR